MHIMVQDYSTLFILLWSEFKDAVPKYPYTQKILTNI